MENRGAQGRLRSAGGEAARAQPGGGTDGEPGAQWFSRGTGGREEEGAVWTQAPSIPALPPPAASLVGRWDGETRGRGVGGV